MFGYLVSCRKQPENASIREVGVRKLAYRRKIDIPADLDKISVLTGRRGDIPAELARKLMLNRATGTRCSITDHDRNLTENLDRNVMGALQFCMQETGDVPAELDRKWRCMKLRGRGFHGADGDVFGAKWSEGDRNFGVKLCEGYYNGL